MGEFGIATYLRNVVRTLGRIDRQNEYILIGAVDAIREELSLPPNFQLVPFGHGEVSYRNHLEFRRMIRHHGGDLVHIPHPFWRPLLVNCPYVMTVHDLLDYMYRAEAKNSFGRLMHFHLTRHVIQHAARIFAVSQFTKQDVCRFFQADPAKIEVTYNALDERFAQGHSSEAERRMLVERYQIDHPFLLYAGRISPHKNVVRIIEAFSALRGQLAAQGVLGDLRLVIIGDQVSQHPGIRRAVIRSGVQQEVRFLGFVPIEVLRVFYDAAKVFVFPSLYEGFGLPPLEAMAHGTPVVTSNTSSLPEVVGDAALQVNPENVFEISRALFRALTDQPLREKMKAKGLEQANKFNWEKSVRRMIEVYQEVAESGKKM
jgi:glycosyltransferase involved in cell wall biosynthesis